MYHYTLLATSTHTSAQSWLSALLATTLHSAHQTRHTSHVSRGFIAHGTRHSLLVLHNATNPFTRPPAPVCTVTLGTYGYHAHQHDAIHWTTLALDTGVLAPAHAWTSTALPAQRRFHRAYWLAANRRGLGGLLNRAPAGERAVDVGDEGAGDAEDGFGISCADLTNVWDVTDEEAAEAWRGVQSVVEGLGEGGGEGWEHVVIANSEW